MSERDGGFAAVPRSAGRRRGTLVERRDGTILRQMTIYHPPELARGLGVYCAACELEVSEVLATLVAKLLDPDGDK
jgi:hypothetical protein